MLALANPMTFWQIFVRVLPWRPFAAVKSLWWYVTGRRLRARNRLRAAGALLPFAYEAWMQTSERGEDLKDRVVPTCATWPWRPSFSILLSVGTNCSESDLNRSFRSIQRQLYPEWSLFIAGAQPNSYPDIFADERVRILDGFDDIAGEAATVERLKGSGDYVMPVRAGDELSPWALFRFAEALQAEPEAIIVYGDHDEVDAGGRRRAPWFKPRWNEEMFLAQDFLSGAVALGSNAASELSGELPAGASFYELLLVAARNGGGPVIHVPHIVAHLRSGDRDSDQQTRVEAVSRHVAASGAIVRSGPFESVKVSWPLPAERPLVSIIIPTKDKLELLRPCVESVLERTTYEPFEILIVDNGSVESRTAKYLNEIDGHSKVRVLPYPSPYNYSAINNFAVREAKGAYLCLLNNDTEVVEDEWLTELMRYAVRDDVGAVGAKLLYPDRTIQHAGVVVGIGGAAGHAHRNLPDTEAGYFSQAHTPQFVTAVTGACLVVEKRKFLGVGGFDEEGLAVAYNDVDLCLKLEHSGWRNVYVPHAVLIHHESKSRGKDYSPSQIDRYRRELKIFQNRWGTTTYDDPLLNPNLDRSSETFLIRL
jgi:GT2 family glycosyltransferase